MWAQDAHVLSVRGLHTFLKNFQVGISLFGPQFFKFTSKLFALFGEFVQKTSENLCSKFSQHLHHWQRSSKKVLIYGKTNFGEDS